MRCLLPHNKHNLPSTIRPIQNQDFLNIKNSYIVIYIYIFIITVSSAVFYTGFLCQIQIHSVYDRRLLCNGDETQGNASPTGGAFPAFRGSSEWSAQGTLAYLPGAGCLNTPENICKIQTILICLNPSIRYCLHKSPKPI